MSSEFVKRLMEIKSLSEKRTSNEGGYLIPAYIDCYKDGVSAAFWRFIGKTFRRDDWYNRGIESVNVYEALTKGLEHDRKC